MAGLTLSQALLSIFSGIFVALFSAYVSRVKEEKHWLMDELYPSLYNEVKSSGANRFPTNSSGDYSSVWETIDQYTKYRVDSTLQTNLDAYSNKLSSLNTLTEQIRFNQKIASSLPDSIVEMTGDGVRIEKTGTNQEPPYHYISIIDWIDLFGDAIIESNNPDEMREKILNKASQNDLNFKTTIEAWEKEEPEWHTDFYHLFNSPESNVSSDIRQYVQLRDEEIPQLIEELEQELETRTKEGLTLTLLRRLTR